MRIGRSFPLNTRLLRVFGGPLVTALGLVPDSSLYLAELTVYDAGIPGTRVLRYSSGLGFVTKPTETPADEYYAARIKQPALVKRDLFQSGTTQGQSRVGYGDLVLINDDGALDGLLEYGFDGRQIVIRQGSPGAAYPNGFLTVLNGTMEQVDVNSSVVTVKVRDRQFELDKPLQPTKYLGNNVLPNGLEGVTDIKDKPKPVCYGQALNVSPVLVNTAKLIYQVNNGAVASVDAVYDRGMSLVTSIPLTPRVSGFGSSTVHKIAYGNGMYVAVGTDGKLASSPDGITWTLRTSQFGTDYIGSVAYAAGVFVAVGGNTTLKISTSPDGITWTARTPATGSGAFEGVAYGNGVFVAGGLSTNPHVETSPDGITWTNRTFAWTNNTSSIAGVAYGNGVFIAVGVNGQISTSPTGTTWTQRTSRFVVGDTIYAIATGNGIIVAGGTGGKVSISTDGETWTLVETDFGAAAIYGLGYGNGIFVAAGTVTDNAIGTSADGTQWTKRTSGLSAGGRGVGFGNNLFLVSGFSGVIGASTPPSTYASQADLLDDTLAPVPGTFKSYPAGGYFRLGSSPAGTVTADVTQGTTAADRTAAQIYKTILTSAGKTASDYAADDIAALDTANNSVLGFYADEERKFSDVMDGVVGSVGAWWGVDRNGVFRIRQLSAPTGSPVISLSANDLLKSPERVSTRDEGNGIPVFKSIVRYQKNYTVQTTDLAAGVTDSRRVVVGKEWREASYTDATVQTKHLLSPQTLDESLLTVEANAVSEATRRQILRGVRRDRFILQVKLDGTTVTLDMGDVIQLVHPRYGLSAGKTFIVLSLEPNASDRTLSLQVWG